MKTKMMAALHLWQSVLPSLCADSVSDTDDVSDFAIASIMGIPLSDFHGHVRSQAHLPQRHGGNGHRRSENVWRAARVGGFCLAAHGPFNIFGVAPFLRDDVLFPEKSSLPSLVELASAWKHCVGRFPRLWHLPQAAVGGVVRPPTEDPRLEDPSTWAQQLDDQQARLETVFKSQLVKGTLPAAEDDPAWCFQQDLEIQRRSFAVAADGGDGWSDFKKDCFWARQGGEKFQRPIAVSGWLSRLCPDSGPALMRRLGGRLQIRLRRGRIWIRALLDLKPAWCVG
jgi:hypothetical protein